MARLTRFFLIFAAFSLFHSSQVSAQNGTITPTPSSSPASCTPELCGSFSKRDPNDACACVSLLACDQRQRRRLEYRQLTADQRAAFVRGVQTLEASGVWGAISDAHARDFGTIHGLGNFFPWHTGMLFYIETLLMDLEPSLPGLPFFPWGLDSPIRQSTMWTSEFIGGSSLSRAPIPNGPFAGFSVDGSVVTRDLFRDSLETATGETIQAVIANEPGYPFWSTTGPSLSDELELLHNIFHIVVGGTMLTGDSPQDPVFYLHHAYVDKWWAQDWPARRGFVAEDEPEEMLAGLPLTRSYENLGGFSLADSVEIQRCVTYEGRTARLVPSSVQSAEEIVGTMVESPRNVMLLSQLQGTSMTEVEDTVEAIAEAVVSVRRR